MKIRKLKEGAYKGNFMDEIGVIYTEKDARARFPDQFKAPKKAVKKSVKKAKR